MNHPTQRSAWTTSLLLAALFAASPLWTTRLRPGEYEGGHSREAGAWAQRNTSSAATMLGEFRTALSDIMFIKTERYLHSGVAYQAHLQGEKLTTVGMIAGVDEHQAEVAGESSGHVHGPACRHGEAHEGHDHDDAGTPTLIPTADKDFRGVLGELHRRVKPWRDPSEPHHHTDGRELLPWFRVMTLSDPHYIRGYAVGGWWLQRRNLDAAFQFVEEGERNNPASFEILYTLGQLHLERGRAANGGELMRPTEEARQHFLKARDTFRRAADLACRQRPADWSDGGEHPSDWNGYRESDALGAARMAVLCEKNYGDPERARRLARHYLDRLSEDDTLRRNAEAM